MSKISIDVQTGEVTESELTEDELLEIEETAAALAALPTVVPSSVTMRQARLALLQAGLLSSVTAAMQAIPDEMQKQAALIEWEFAATVDKDSPWVANLTTALELTPEVLDALFLAADGL